MSFVALAKSCTYGLSHYAARLIAATFFQIRVFGREHLPRTGGGLVCANHQSYLDPVLVGLACDRPLNYLARESLFGFAPFRWLIEWYNAIPIDREGLGLSGLKETLTRMRRGELVLIFPEGTRTADGEMQPLKPGFGAVARRGRGPLVPVGIDGAFDAWPRSRKLPGVATIHIHLGPPIDTPLVETLDDDALLAELERRMRACHAAAVATRGHATA